MLAVQNFTISAANHLFLLGVSPQRVLRFTNAEYREVNLVARYASLECVIFAGNCEVLDRHEIVNRF
ncbi:MAG: hypothetical protein UY07_C0034G0002 [Parcubacteria group bacterium GW2011_GWA1_47_8]|nr:MAG: hypothetical protein UY07_C0034G0002 [Parcubacteria group bacterium GW2011_GWA1_47_8]KKW07320.1 MAG: hypothetical protein UY42_C0014G0019 [Parcubacteria group bacterium GW2011_GWA2_49_16]